MPEPNTPSAVVETTPTPVVAPATPTTPAEPALVPANDNAARREAINQRYTEIYGGAKTEPDAPVVTPAQSDTSVVAEPVVAAPPSTPSETPAPDRLATVEANLASLTEMLTKALSPTPPVIQAPAGGDPVSNDFWELARAGKLKEAEELLINKAVSAATTRAVAESTEAHRIETDITSFISDLRGKNPDLVPLEELITTKAAQKLELAQKSGKIKNTSDYVREYKSAVNSATDETRTIFQSIRGVGKTEAMTRSKEVVSASTMTPQAIDQARGEQKTAPPVDTTQDYLAKRLAHVAKINGMSV